MERVISTDFHAPASLVEMVQKEMERRVPDLLFGESVVRQYLSAVHTWIVWREQHDEFPNELERNARYFAEAVVMLERDAGLQRADDLEHHQLMRTKEWLLHGGARPDPDEVNTQTVTAVQTTLVKGGQKKAVNPALGISTWEPVMLIPPAVRTSHASEFGDRSERALLQF